MGRCNMNPPILIELVSILVRIHQVEHVVGAWLMGISAMSHVSCFEEMVGYLL